MKTLRLFTVLFILTNFCLQAYSQKERNTWCFGSFARLDFTSGSPVYSRYSDINTIEGCASISDYNTGRLLFYSDGSKVWDSTNQVMPSDTLLGLGGNSSTSQSAYILPMPGSNHKYYLFCTDAQAGYVGGAGFGADSGTEYSIIDMNLNSGLGDITQPPRPLLTPAAEKIAAAFNSDSTGYWLIIHLWNSDAFYVYPITTSGIGDPVISHSGVQANADGTTDNSSDIGCMRISPDGSKIAIAWHDSINTLQLFNFDVTTGTVSQPFFTHSGYGALGPYGVCFSPNNRFLYYTLDENKAVYQYNLQALSDTGILISHTFSNAWAIQMGPDNKLYVAIEDNSAIDQIEFPDSAGLACNYHAGAISIGSATCHVGLPEFPPMGANKAALVTAVKDLVEETISVYPNPTAGSLQVAVDNNLVGGNLDVYDNEGRLIYHSKIQTLNFKIDLPVANGVYLLRISSPSVSIVRKVVRL